MTSRIEELLAEARWLEGLARALVCEREEARELVQEVWLRTLEQPPRDVRRPRAWLGRVLRNVLGSRRRSESARASRERARERELAHGADDVVERAEGQRLLVEAVLSLDEPLRRTVLLRFFDGLSSAEIARRLGVPDSTVRTRLAQALELLRARLGRSRTDWRTGLALIVCADKELERAKLHPGVKVGLWLGAGVLAGLWLLGEFLPARRAPTARVSASNASAPVLVTVDSAQAAREEAESVPASAPPQAPVASEVSRLRIVADLVAEGSETPIAGAEIRLADCLVATGDAHGHVDQEFVLRADAPRELRRRFEDSLEYEVTSHFVVWAPGWSQRYVEIPGRLEGSVHLGLLALHPAGEARGVVRDDAGRLVPHARVTWRAGERSPLPDEAPWGWNIEERWMGASPECVSDTEGRFDLRGVPFEAGFLQASSPMHGRGYGPVFRSSVGETPEFSLVLPPYPEFVARIDGVVLDPAGVPLPEARVRVFFDGGLHLELEADDRGRFEGVWHGAGAISLVAGDAARRYSPVRLDCPDVRSARDLSLRLTPPSTATVQVNTTAGAAIIGARVTGHWPLGNASEWDQGTFHTDESGRLVLVRPPGAFALRAEAPGFAVGRLELPKDGELSEPVVIVLEAAPSVRGRLVRAGQPIAGALVHAGRSAGLAIRSTRVFSGEEAFDLASNGSHSALLPARTDADGRFVVTHTVKDGLTLLMEASGLPLTAFGPFTAPHPEERELEIGSGGTPAVASGPTRPGRP